MTEKSKLFSSLFVVLGVDDQKLMLKVQAGNQWAFEKLFDRYKDKMMSYCLRMVHSKSIAEELTHEIFLKVYRNRESYSSEYKFSTWIWTIARNTCLDYLRKKKELSLEDTHNYDEEASGYEEKISSNDIDIESALILKAQKETLAKCMKGLKDSQREALSLRIFSELSYQEIAEQLKSTEKSIKSLINRAKVNLVDCVKQCLEDEEKNLS